MSQHRLRINGDPDLEFEISKTTDSNSTGAYTQRFATVDVSHLPDSGVFTIEKLEVFNGKELVFKEILPKGSRMIFFKCDPVKICLSLHITKIKPLGDLS